MTARLLGMKTLDSKFNAMIKGVEKKIIDIRKRVAKELVMALVENVPVWSGRTVRSISVSNTGASGNSQEPHPDRGDTDFDGKPWFSHSEYGATSRMSMGSEPMRAPSEARALASVETATYDLDKPVFVTSNSYMWAEVDSARAPDSASARNGAVVSRIAVEKVRSAMKGLVK